MNTPTDTTTPASNPPAPPSAESIITAIEIMDASLNEAVKTATQNGVSSEIIMGYLETYKVLLRAAIIRGTFATLKPAIHE